MRIYQIFIIDKIKLVEGCLRLIRLVHFIPFLEKLKAVVAYVHNEMN